MNSSEVVAASWINKARAQRLAAYIGGMMLEVTRRDGRAGWLVANGSGAVIGRGGVIVGLLGDLRNAGVL